jgi:uroporphyrinogen decarboxylase
MMKDYNRIQAAERGFADRVPIYGQIHEYVMASSGIPAREFYSNGKLLVRKTMEIAEKLGLDDPHIAHDTYNIEAEALGMKVKYFNNKVPSLVNEPLIKKKEDLKTLKPPRPGKDGRMPFVLEVIKEYQKLGIKPKLHPSISFTAPFTLAAQLRGVTNFLIDTIQDTTFAHDLLSFVTEEVLKPWIFGGADALASPPNMSIKGIKEFALNYILKLRKQFEDEAAVQNWVGESYIREARELLEIKLIASPKIIIGQDPDVEKIGPEIYKEFAKKHDVPLVLGIGNTFLMFSTPNEIKQRIKRYVEVGKEWGKFLLYLCNVGANNSPENLEAVINAVQEYGQYK